MMFRPRISAFLIGALLLLACALPLEAVRAQQQPQTPPASDDTARGIELFEQGDAKQAIKLLRKAVENRKDDLNGWHYLALAYVSTGKEKDARKAFEQAAALRDTLFWQEYAAWRTNDGGVGTGDGTPGPEARPARRTQFAADIRAVIADMEKRPPPPAKLVDEWNNYLDDLRFYLEMTERPEHQILSTKGETTKAIITAKPEPGFTEEARENSVAGVIRLRVILSFDGRVRHVQVLTGLPHGLTEMAVKAARRIKFKPATFDGQPVSQWVVIEYNFNIY
jgi:TonB family protein